MAIILEKVQKFIYEKLQRNCFVVFFLIHIDILFVFLIMEMFKKTKRRGHL